MKAISLFAITLLFLPLAYADYPHTPPNIITRFDTEFYPHQSYIVLEIENRNAVDHPIREVSVYISNFGNDPDKVVVMVASPDFRGWDVDWTDWDKHDGLTQIWFGASTLEQVLTTGKNIRFNIVLSEEYRQYCEWYAEYWIRDWKSFEPVRYEAKVLQNEGCIGG